MELKTSMFLQRALNRFAYEVHRRQGRVGGPKFADKRPEDIVSKDGNALPDRVLIITQPKAGTYLLAEILRNCGLDDTKLHLGRDRLQAYEPKALEVGLQDPRLFDIVCPIEESRCLIRSGQVAVSHLPYARDLERYLGGFKIVHSKRDLRTSFRSWARMYLGSKKKGEKYKTAIAKEGISGLMRLRGEAIISEALRIDEWGKCDNVLSFKIEEIFVEPSRVIGGIMKHLGVEPGRSINEIWDRARTADTLTKSSSFPDLKWTEREEDVFRKIGGIEANKKLGYA